MSEPLDSLLDRCQKDDQFKELTEAFFIMTGGANFLPAEIRAQEMQKAKEVVHNAPMNRAYDALMLAAIAQVSEVKGVWEE